MSKTVNFDLTIKFSDKIISDDDYKTIAQNICTAIMREAENYGISPDSSDMYVEFVSVGNPLTGTKVVRELFSRICNIVK